MGDVVAIETEVTYPTDKFHSTLNEVANHRFVTEDTHEYRKLAEDWMRDIKEGFKVLGVDKCAFVATGSVAVGMVSKEAGSDIDGRIFYSESGANSEMLTQFMRKAPQPDQVQLLVYAETDSLINGVQQDAEAALETGNAELVGSDARVFAPSLSEFTDQGERKIMDSWRAAIIQKLAELPDNKGERAWELFRDTLDRQFVHYENSIGGDETKRKGRIESVISNKLNEIYPQDERRQNLAKAVVESSRSSFRYPSFDEMKEIFLGTGSQS